MNLHEKLTFLVNYSGLIVLVVGTAVLLLIFGKQFINEFKSLWNE